MLAFLGQKIQNRRLRSPLHQTGTTIFQAKRSIVRWHAARKGPTSEAPMPDSSTETDLSKTDPDGPEDPTIPEIFVPPAPDEPGDDLTD